jgi:hypothetical protein
VAPFATPGRGDVGRYDRHFPAQSPLHLPPVCRRIAIPRQRSAARSERATHCFCGLFFRRDYGLQPLPVARPKSDFDTLLHPARLAYPRATANASLAPIQPRLLRSYRRQHDPAVTILSELRQHPGLNQPRLAGPEAQMMTRKRASPCVRRASSRSMIDEEWLCPATHEPLDRHKYDRAAFSCGHDRVTTS